MADEIIGRISVGDGATFTPSVSDEGVLSWENNKNLPNPDDVDLAQAVIDKGGLAPINSPAFTGTPTAPTPTASDDSTKIATTEFVHDNTDNKLPLAGGTLTGQLVINKSNPSTPNDAGIKLIGAAQNFVISASRTDVTKGTAPSGTKNWGIDFYGTDIDSYNKRIGMLETSLLSNNIASTAIRAYSCGSNTSTTDCYISVNIDENGNGFTYAPTPANGNNSNEIATTAFCKNNYLPLSGGTLTGNITFGTTGNHYIKTNGSSQVAILSGAGTPDGACLFLNSRDWTSGNAGEFTLRASNKTDWGDTQHSSIDLVGRPDGTLQWGGQDVVVSNGNLPKRLTWTGANSSAVIRGSSTTSATNYFGGSEWNNGSSILLSGNDDSSAGQFRIRTHDGTSQHDLTGTKTGGLSWQGQPIQTSSDKRLKQDFSNVPDEVLEAWGKVNWQQFKYKADVERKGDSCRFHTGLVAQDVKEVGEENNVDLLKYGILCHDVREATEDSEAVDLWTVRYEEALAMEVIYLRNEIKKLREEIKALRTE